jgi:F-type H+-transporting ATPase subunit gamma
MATLREVKRKINSINSTQTITRTMRMISASKLRRAQEELEKVNAYSVRMEQLMGRLAGRLPENISPLVGDREEVKNALLFPIASDRGLSGAFNMNIATTVERFMNGNKNVYESIGVYLMGRKIRDYLKRRRVEPIKEWLDLKTIDTDIAETMAKDLTDLYLSGQYDKVYLIYTHYDSPARQSVRFEEFLPLKAATATGESLDYLYEPDMASIVEKFFPQYIFTKIYFALIQSQTSEHAARMAAMENATKSCGEMIDHLTLVYNKTRQASITNEMMDIVGGAEALS